MSFPLGSVVKNSPANARDGPWIPGFGRCPGEENGSPLQYSYLEYPMDREAWWVIISEVTKELDMTERKKNNKERTKRRL